MNLDLSQLRALDVTVREGTLEAAARALHLTPSAISQRLRALEVATGRVLLVRTKPVRATESGQAVLRLARQLELLTADVARELGEGDTKGRTTLPIAVNADSMATWVLPALAPLAGEYCFDLHREDQEHTSALLRAGTVMAAVTAEAAPVPGCTSTRLGSMRYRPMATPAFAGRWFPDGPTPEALARAPVVTFDRKDDLQHRFLRQGGAADARPPAHYVPASADFVASGRLGAVLDELAETCDLVLIDAPPILQVSDAMALTAKVDALVVVTKLSAVRRPALNELRRVMDHAPIAKLGFVLTGVRAQEGYGYGYGHAFEETATNGSARRLFEEV